MSGNAYNVGALIATMGLDTTQFQAGMASVNASTAAASAATKKATASMTASMAAAGAKMQTIGKNMSRYLTLPIVAFGLASTKVFADFESSMAKITGLVGVAKSQVEEWKKEVLALGPATGQGPEKLADALFYITSAGIRGAEAMEVLEMSAKAATSGLGEASVIADLVTSAMNAYGKENLNAAKATDILVATVREGKAEASSLAAAMGMVLPIASEYGVTFDQVGAAFAGMTRTGTNARVAATQLKAILSSMASPALQAEDAMKKYGTSSAQFRKDIEEQGLIQALGNLKTAVNGNKVAMAEIFPNIRGLMGVLDLLGKNAKQNEEIFASLTDASGSLDTAFESASDTVKFKFNKGIATLKTNMITLGTALSSTLIPLIEKATTFVAGITEKWNKLSTAQQQNKLRVLALTAAMGPLLSITGRLVKLLSTPKGPYAMAIAGAIALTLAIRQLVMKHREEKEVLDAVGTANQKIKTLYETQAAKIAYLVAIIEDENISNAGRISAINELKSIMPGYNATLTAEGVLVNHNKTTIDGYLVALKEKIKLQVFESEYVAILKKQVQAQRDLDKATTDARIAREKYDEAGGKDYTQITTSGAGPMGMVGATVKAVSKERSALNEANTTLDERKSKLAEVTQAQADLNEEMKRMDIVLSGASGSGSGGVGSGGGEGGGGDDGTAFLERQAQARLDLIRMMEDEALELYVNSFQKKAAAEQLSFERTKANLEKQGEDKLLTEDEVNRGIEALEAAHQVRMEAITKEGADAAAQAIQEAEDKKAAARRKTEDEEQKAKDKAKHDAQEAYDEKIENVLKYMHAASRAVTALSDLTTRAMDKELAAAGTNKEAREKIEKEYFQKQKKWAIAQAVINGAVAVTNMIGNVPLSVLNPATWIGIGIAAAATAAEVAVIASQNFAEGGIVYGPTTANIGEYPGARSDPEIVSPLSKLKTIIGDVGDTKGKVRFEIDGRVLVGILEKEQTFSQSY